MGTTVWVSDSTRESLRRLQDNLGTPSADATIRRLLDRPALDARTLFALHETKVRKILARHHLKGLVAFGSRARGDARESSDLDLAAEPALDADPLAILAAEADLEEALGIPVNLVELPNPRLERTIRVEGVRFGE